MAELRLKRLQEQRQHLSFNVRYFPKKQAQIEATQEDNIKSRFLKSKKYAEYVNDINNQMYQ